VPVPVIEQVQADGGGVVVSGVGGVAGAPYYVLTSTDLALPLSQWTILATNLFGGAGEFEFTNAVNGTPQQFFRVEVP
jgi:hypothetical protein